MKRTLYLLTAATLFLASCGGGDGENLAELKKQRAEIDAKIKKLEAGQKSNTGKVTPVAIASVITQTFNGNIEVQSVISGDENILAQSTVGGEVKSINVTVGQRVSKGQVLAVIDATTLEQSMASLAPQLSLAKSLYEKQQKLWAQNIGSEVQLEQAKTNYEGLVKQIDALKAQRNLAKIVSPINGVIDEINVKIGEVTSAQNPTSGIRVVNYDKLKAEAMLGENYLGKLKAGDKVTVVLGDNEDSLSTTLSYVGQSVDAMSRAFKVTVKLPNSAKLHPNMSCVMKISNYTNTNAIVVPVAVIQKTGEGSIVYIADGNTAKAVPVTIGRISNGNAEIMSGLNEGDHLITAGFEELENGQKIIVQSL